MKEQKIQLNTDIIPKGGRILVALSGGADSVCLLHALHGAAGELGLELRAAHYIHGIRPDRAAEELALVRRLCARLNVALSVGQGDVPAYAGTHGMGLEEAARELRYGFLRRTAAETGCCAIAVAHHRGDHAETVLLNLTRGTGLAGLGGIPAVNGDVIRPLLGVSRREIEAYDAAHGLEYAVDATNLEPVCGRNRIRLEVMPQLRLLNPDAEGALVRAAAHAREAQDFIMQSARALLPAGRVPGSAARQCLRDCHPALRRAMLALLLDEAGAGTGLLDEAHTDAVCRLAAGERASGRVDLGAGWTARVDYAALYIEKKEASEAQPVRAPVALTPGQPVCWQGWEVCLAPAAPEGTAFRAAGLEGPVVVRARLPGDRVAFPEGHKTIKKIMIDRKIPVKTRDRIPVVCDNKGVLLVGDLEKDRRRAAGKEDTEQRVYICCRRIDI